MWREAFWGGMLRSQYVSKPNKLGGFTRSFEAICFYPNPPPYICWFTFRFYPIVSKKCTAVIIISWIIFLVIVIEISLRFAWSAKNFQRDSISCSYFQNALRTSTHLNNFLYNCTNFQSSNWDFRLLRFIRQKTALNSVKIPEEFRFFFNWTQDKIQRSLFIKYLVILIRWELFLTQVLIPLKFIIIYTIIISYQSMDLLWLILKFSLMALQSNSLETDIVSYNGDRIYQLYWT